jgi:putative hydrolase of the HAD superfamily
MTPYTEIKAITLDLDDTLWPVLPTLINAENTLNDWLATHSPKTAELLATPARQTLAHQIATENPKQRHNVSWFRQELLRLAMAQAYEDPNKAMAAFEVFLEARQDVTCYDEVIETLNRWATRYPLVAITNGNADVERVGLGQFFKEAIYAHEQGFAKPDPRMFEQARSRLGIEAHEILHIGDDWHLDVVAARNAGMQTAWIKRADVNHDKVPPESDKEMHVFEDLAALDAFMHP